MALFEPPTAPDPVPHDQPRTPLTSSPYAAMEHHELLQLIDDLNDERARARFREGVWMALFAHMLFFALVYLLQTIVFHGVKVINPIDAMRQNDRQIFLNAPPEIQRNTQRQRSTPKPAARALDQKTLQELQREAEAEAAARAAAEAQQRQQQKQAPPPEVAKNEPLLPMPEAPKPQTSPLPGAPEPQTHPAPAAQGSSALDDQFKQQIQQSAIAAAHGSGGQSYSGSVSMGHQGVGTGMQILTDTQGVDFGPYMERLRYIIEHAWQPLIPESVYPPLLKQGVVGILFTIDKNGKLADIKLETPSGDVALDKAAWGSIVGPQPFPPLPKEFPGKNIQIRGGFFYNIPPE